MENRASHKMKHAVIRNMSYASEIRKYLSISKVTKHFQARRRIMLHKVLSTVYAFVICMILTSGLLAEVPQVINYQGRLTQPDGNPVADGPYPINFIIYNASEAGDSLWAEFASIDVANGLFGHQLGVITSLPSDLFSSDTACWLEIRVGDEIIIPRSKLVSVPYAYHALRADTADYAFACNGGSGGNWTVIDSVLYTNNNWGLARGNAGNIMYGDSTHTMVNLGISCVTGRSDVAELRCATIGGGAANVASAWYTTVAGGYYNSATGDRAVVGGGYYNVALGGKSTVSGGWLNEATSSASAVGGGFQNTAGFYCTVGGGANNKAHGAYSVVSGGGGFEDADSNSALGNWSAIVGGLKNIAGGANSFIGGGKGNLVEGDYAVIPGGYADTITETAAYSYLFGIGSKLTQDSTFMVDMPHIRFGNELDGYELPANDGMANQIMATDGNGLLTWTDNSGGGSSGWTDDGTVIRLNTNSDNVGIGTDTPTEKLTVRGNILILSESTGDPVIELGEGLDYAEGFNVSNLEAISAGAVLVIDPNNPGKLALTNMPYDCRVAGIVAGARGLGSGVRLGAGSFDFDVALAGRVYCNVDATTEGVEPGDLLTSSTSPGYAMKASDYTRARGAILGKAMQRLEKGQKGQILVLVTLQ